MPSSVEITFNENPAGACFSGQALSGQVKLITEKDKLIRGIFITIQGHARVKWMESENGGKAVIVYTAREDYLKSRIYLMGSDDGESFNLAAGQYEFDFQIQLPSELPTSFHGLYGKIKYEVVCTIDRAKKFDNVFKQPFTVIQPVDFNVQPSYLCPVERETSKSFSKFLFLGDRGEIIVKLSSPCGGYVPGQSIPVSILIKNHANVSTYETNACIVQKIIYHAKSPFKKDKSEKRTVSLQYLGPLDKSKEKDYQCTLQIPAVAPSSFSSCAVIEILYNVEIQLKTRGLHRSMNAKLPVIIGTVPYGCNQQNDPSVMPSTSNGLSDFDVLPTYEQAIQLGPALSDDNEEDKLTQKMEYAPMYPIYYNLNIPVTLPGRLPPYESLAPPVETKDKL